MATYTIDLGRDEDGVWIVRSPDVPGFHTYSRNLRQARVRVQEALSLWVEDAHPELEYRYRPPRQ